ncbi:MAG: hypothetical protein KBA61_06965 [Spirochaetes bacterium]|nr:hypothetical protein [Spirochaetota bacterium]
MKKILALLVVSLFMVSGVLMAQPATTTTTTPQRAYTAIGLHMPFMYFFSAEEGSMEMGGITFKAPISKTFGVEFDINKLVVPIKEYVFNNTTTEGFGEEEYNNFQLSLLYFMPFNKYIQLKLGVEYLNYVNGYIAINQSATSCGDMRTHCANCQEDMFGVFGGLNLDVPLYERILIMTSLNYHWVFGEHPSMETGYVDFTLGIGYQI